MNPLTRRRERRILKALTYLGPMDDWALYRILNATTGSLNKALLNLVADGRITAKPSGNLMGNGHTWSIAEIADAGGDDD